MKLVEPNFYAIQADLRVMQTQPDPRALLADGGALECIVQAANEREAMKKMTHYLSGQHWEVLRITLCEAIDPDEVQGLPDSKDLKILIDLIEKSRLYGIGIRVALLVAETGPGQTN